MNKNESRLAILTGVVLLSAGCLMFCLMLPVYHPEIVTLKFTVGILLLVVNGITAFCLQIWRSIRFTRRLLYFGSVKSPPQLHKLVVELDLDSSRIIVLPTEEAFALCFGFFKPRICLSTGMINLLSEAQLKATLLHEDYHRQWFDPLRILIAETISKTFFFLPVIQEWYARFTTRMELDADQYAIEKVGKAALAGALHRLLTVSTPQTVFIQGIAVVGFTVAKERVAALLGDRSFSYQISLRSTIYSLAVLVSIGLLIYL
jgi:Zn-dependent protease with chaperone function